MKAYRHLETDLHNSSGWLKNRQRTVELYNALCNNYWCMGEDMCLMHSWRSAARLVAQARGQGEPYMDYYYTGDEGTVTPRVRAKAKTLGWTIRSGNTPPA